ncbi:hypothetical protein M409DRAFT_20046 [Zasmidium cellare ATCC 36951]|uniref:Carboxylic ester hydrolase n=1 Tax=Zasmidium cellare ATCC 36951 TaxID=1080233 RepID=A0A6A6CUY8_ZASCE|nr:uncharacterized protein M409DRAFT_20046 [Zasmidium cellare ATCC 36951]KAF2169632.1 hypothetical protein M409DRAFT_20046 [Zasmidium cellare ATCC 36951]
MASLSMITPVDNLSPDVAQELGLLGCVPALSCVSDPRFSYYLYAPSTYHRQTTAPPRVLVLIHHSLRNAYALREAFRAFALDHNLFLLCPLFPIGFLDPGDTDNYKNLHYRGVHYDRVLLSMVDEVQARYPKIPADTTFGLYGFSGGAQFVHRFAYLHAERLWGLVVAAPGAQTPWDHTRDYPAGVRDLQTVFPGTADGWEGPLRLLPTAFMCGAQDTDVSWARLRGRETPAEGGRLAAARRLREDWVKQGALRTRFVAVEGAAHEESKILECVQGFFDEVLAEGQGQEGKEQQEGKELTTRAKTTTTQQQQQHSYTAHVNPTPKLDAHGVSIVVG